MAQETQEEGLKDIYIKNVNPKMKKDLQEIAKEELTTVSSMARRIFKKAIKDYKLTGNIAA